NTKGQQFKELKLNFQSDFKPAEIKVSQSHYRLIIPILSNHQITGYCSIIRPNNHSSILEKMIIERSSVVCAMYLLNERTAIEAEQRIRGNILEEILIGKLSREEIIKMGQYVGIDLTRSYRIIVLHLFQNENKMNIKEEMEWRDKV